MMPRIALIEDEPAIADSVVYALGKEGLEVVWFNQACTGIAALRTGGWAALILDVGLPDMTGFDACKEIRGFANLPILFLTARGEEIDRVVGFEIGADDYVTKPFSPRELAARVKAILRRASPAPVSTTASEAAASAFVVDAEAFSIRYRNRVLDLTRYETRLLQTLLARPGRIYSRQQLMEEAWEEPGYSLERVVDAHIKSIRAKLRALGPEADCIVTHRGLGYSAKDGA